MTWYGGNEQIAYPLVGTDAGQVPSDLLVDCVIYAPASLGSVLSLTSISCTGLIISCVLSIDGTPVAYLTRQQSQVDVWQTIPVTPIVAGIDGFITFGSGIKQHLLRIDGQYPFLAECLVRYPDVTGSPTLTVGTNQYYGLVKLKTAGGIELAAKTMKIKTDSGGDIVTTVAGVFSTGTKAMLSDPVAECAMSAEGRTPAPVIETINGVYPDPSGTITFRFVTILETAADANVTASASGNTVTITDAGVQCRS